MNETMSTLPSRSSHLRGSPALLLKPSSTTSPCGRQWGENGEQMSAPTQTYPTGISLMFSLLHRYQSVGPGGQGAAQETGTAAFPQLPGLPATGRPGPSIPVAHRKSSGLGQEATLCCQLCYPWPQVPPVKMHHPSLALIVLRGKGGAK